MRPEKGAEILLARVDEACTSLLVDGAEHVKARFLEAFKEDAGRMGFAEAVAVATEVQDSIGALSTTECDLVQTLADGLTRVRHAIDDHVDTTDSGAEPGVAETRDVTILQFAEDAELVRDFLVEAREHLAKIEGQVLALEKNPADMEVIHAIFRTFHTIKGLAGFLNFEQIQRVSHESETLLELARNGRIKIDPPVVDVVLEAADYLRVDLRRIEGQLSGGAMVEPANVQPLLDKIQRLLSTEVAGPVPTESPNATPLTNHGNSGGAYLEPVSIDDYSASTKRAGAPMSDKSRSSASAGDDFTIRVNTAKLDRLLEMVGEMVIAQSLIQHNRLLSASVDDRLHADLAQLSRSTSEVQRTTMSMRMVAIGQLFQRTARLVRDLSRRAGKQVVLETEGVDTEVDKSIAEQLADPILHMVRNCIDHGIEPPNERVAAGKPATARVFLKAYHQAGQIVVEVGDDGRGLSRDKILAKAERNGLIPSGAQLSDAEVWQLIFEPGFSTAEEVTDVSGRGVGMDVVRRNVQKLRGRIEIRSSAGQGSTFLLKLPLTLAIIEGLVVLVGESRYILPLFVVREMFRPTPESLSTVNGCHEVALVRGSLLPVVRLHQRLGISAHATDPCDGLLLVAESNGKQFCLLVDDLIGKQEVVIKNLGETFKDVRGLAGCAILGDGRVGLILDVEGIYCGGER